MRIRQVALVAHDLETVVGQLCDALGVEVAFNDPGVEVFGLRNAVMAVGDTFLEVVSPTREDTSAGRLLSRRGGDGGYMVILQTDDLAADRRRMATLGVRIVWEIAFDDIETIHLHPRDVGGAIISFDEPRPPESWRWAGPTWPASVRTDVSKEIIGVELEAADPAAMAARWAEVTAHPVADCGDGCYEIALERGAIRIVPDRGRADGVSGITVRSAAGAHAGHDICGTRIRLV